MKKLIGTLIGYKPKQNTVKLLSFKPHNTVELRI